MIIHRVTRGETIASIAERYGISTEDIINTNFPPDPNNLVPGQTLVILQPEIVHTVVQGDTLESIGRQYNTDVSALLRNNPSIESDNIQPGQEIVIAYKDTNPTKEIAVNGYTYPSIDRRLLMRTLPYLSFLTIFTYGFTEEGQLIAPDDSELIALALEYGVAPVMLISTLTEEGTFSNELASILLSSAEIQERLIENILNNMEEKGYRALDIDFEYLPAENRDSYIAFVENITQRLNQKGYFSLVALAPKTSTDQPGLLYESHDYFGLGRAANLALLMTYEWGYTYGPPMPVSPLPNVEQVIRYGVTQIPSQKVLMGVPLYGYDWQLPYVRGTTKAKSLSPQQAIALAADMGADIQYDSELSAPFYYYNDGSNEHIVWFEDADSVEAKLGLVNKYGLAGVSYWNITRDFPQNWLVLNSLFRIAKIL